MIPFVAKGTQQLDTLEEQSLDDAARRVTAGLSRRGACRALGGGALGAIFAGLGLSDVLARCNGVGKRCRRNNQCCSGRCKRRKCRRARGGSKPEPDGPRIDIDPPSPVDVPLPPPFDPPVLPTLERRRLVISGTIAITDDETFGGDEVCRHRVDEFFLRIPSLFDGSLSRAAEFYRGCGGEVRVVVTVAALLQSDGDINVSGQVKLYEGTSEWTSDLDGGENLPSFRLPKGATTTKTVTVHNEDEGGDHATVRLTFRNLA